MSSTIHLSIKRRFEASVAPDVQTVDVAQKAVFVCDVKSPHADKGNGRLANLVAQGRALKQKELGRGCGQVVVVKWSACSLYTPAILVRIALTPTVFSVKFVFEKNENKQKEAGVGPFKKVDRVKEQ